MVMTYLDKNHLKFDRNMLRYMFAEADFDNQGYLTLADLLACTQGRRAQAPYIPSVRTQI